MTRRLLLILLALSSLALAACGDKQKTITHGESEAQFVTLGQMQYQVQLSRQLNQADVGDRALLVGIPPADRGLKPDEVWFAVWVRITNKSDNVGTGADEFKIVDTRGRLFKPIALQRINPFAYRSTPVLPGGVYPRLNSVATSTPPGGALLLFKLQLPALDFRPLELGFSSTLVPKAESSVRLDL